jgi:hypothetical protein
MEVSGQFHAPAALLPGKEPHWIGDGVGPRAVLYAVVKRKIPSPRRESNPRTPIVQPVTQSYADWAITALQCVYIYEWTRERIDRRRVAEQMDTQHTSVILFKLSKLHISKLLQKLQGWNSQARYTSIPSASWDCLSTLLYTLTTGYFNYNTIMKLALFKDLILWLFQGLRALRVGRDFTIPDPKTC